MKDFETKNEKAMASIILSLHPSQLNHVKNCETDFVAWKILHDIHQLSGPARKVMLFRKSLQFSLAEGGIIGEHMNVLSSLVDQLAEFKITVNEAMIVILLLSSLPKSYEGFVVAMESRDTLPEFSSLNIKLLEEGVR